MGWMLVGWQLPDTRTPAWHLVAADSVPALLDQPERPDPVPAATQLLTLEAEPGFGVACAASSSPCTAPAPTTCGPGSCSWLASSTCPAAGCLLWRRQL